MGDLTEVVILANLKIRNINKKIGKRGISHKAKLQHAITCAPVKREHNIQSACIKSAARQRRTCDERRNPETGKESVGSD